MNPQSTRNGTSVKSRISFDNGFSTAELLVVILVIAILVAILLPAMSSLVYSTRLAGAKQDAASIGAAIELLKLEGRYDPDDDRLYDKICEESGMSFSGNISELRADGGFLYIVTAGNATYAVRYDASTGNVDELSVDAPP